MQDYREDEGNISDEQPVSANQIFSNSMILDQKKQPAFDKTRLSDSTFRQSNDSMLLQSFIKGHTKTDQTQEITKRQVLV